MMEAQAHQGTPLFPGQQPQPDRQQQAAQPSKPGKRKTSDPPPKKAKKSKVGKLALQYTLSQGVTLWPQHSMAWRGTLHDTQWEIVGQALHITGLVIFTGSHINSCFFMVVVLLVEAILSFVQLFCGYIMYVEYLVMLIPLLKQQSNQ